MIRHLSTFILITLVACLIGACDSPRPSGKAIFRAAFLQVFHDGKPQPLAISIAFPKCAHQTVFGTGKCRHLLCNVIVDGNNRNRERERVVCEDAEQELLPKLDRVRTKDGCYRVLAEYAIRLLKMHAIDPELHCDENNTDVTPRMDYLPRSMRQRYGDGRELTPELRQVWAI
jgi:hypothetical protein